MRIAFTCYYYVQNWSYIWTAVIVRHVSQVIHAKIEPDSDKEREEERKYLYFAILANVILIPSYWSTFSKDLFKGFNIF